MSLLFIMLIVACVPGRYLSAEHERGMELLAQVQPLEACESFQKGLVQARQKNDVNLQVRLLELSGWAKAEAMQFLEAQKLLFEARDLAEQNGIDAAVIDAFMKNSGMPLDMLLLKAVLGFETVRTAAYCFMGDYNAAIRTGKKANAHFEASRAV